MRDRREAMMRSIVVILHRSIEAMMRDREETMRDREATAMRFDVK
jgi:hypothetical protein